VAGKAVVTLGRTHLAATGSIVWRFQTGVTPYTTVFEVHKSAWDGELKQQVGRNLELQVTDFRGVITTVKDVTILHTVASSSPARRAFVVADRRWRWPYKLIARDYNVAKRTGDRTALLEEVPVSPQTTQVVDEYDYRPYSLNNGARWTAEAAVKDLLELLEPSSGTESLASSTSRTSSFGIRVTWRSRGCCLTSRARRSMSIRTAWFE
jgi:hypothetical protein